MKTGKSFLILLALLAFLGVGGPVTAGVATEVVVNRSVLLNLQKPSERVSIANPGIAELVVISPTQLQINGKKVGYTSLIVWSKGGGTSFFDVRVKGESALLEEQIREIAPNDSITVDYANDTIILRGKATNEVTVAKAVKLAQAYVEKVAEENAYKDEKNGTPQANRAGIMSMNGNGSYFPDGNNYLTEPKNIYDSSLGSEKVIQPEDKVLNYIEIDDPQQVLLEVKVAQVDKSALKSLGISALVKGASGEGFSNPQIIGAPSGDILKENIIKPGIAGDIHNLGAIFPSDPFQLGFSHYKSGIGAVLTALATKNLAKILAEPNLLVKSGQEGRFHVGQKIPIAVLYSVGGAAETTIKYEEIGIRLHFKPRVLENGLISLKIDPAEVSSLGATLPNGYPIIDTRKTQTNVQLKDGESLVLSGILREDTIKRMRKIPLLGDIPILGALFRATDDELKETELVFFITTKLVNPNAPGTLTELPTDRPLTPQQEKDFEWMPKGD